MSLDEPIEVDLEKASIERRITEVRALFADTTKEGKLRLLVELAEELSKEYHVDLVVKQRKEHEILGKKIVISLVETPDIKKWLDFR